MRINEPVTQREFELPDDSTLMTTTDPDSRITYGNQAFFDASGFTREESQGQLHNMVRHPDMPPQAFADMWATLRGGEPWTALVKNRRKNGDHYWVRANATPVIRNGKHVGYMSVRTKPSREEVAGPRRSMAPCAMARPATCTSTRGWWSARGCRHGAVGARPCQRAGASA
jgi:aerotaxis receptor